MCVLGSMGTGGRGYGRVLLLMTVGNLLTGLAVICLLMGIILGALS